MAWDTVQKKMMCCGIDGPRNWFDQNNGTASGIPARCKIKLLTFFNGFTPFLFLFILNLYSCCRPQYIDRDTQNCLNAAPLYMDRMYQVIEHCVNRHQ